MITDDIFSSQLVPTPRWPAGLVHCHDCAKEARDLAKRLEDTEARRYAEHARAEMYKAENRALQNKLCKVRWLRRLEREDLDFTKGLLAYYREGREVV